ncbi:chloride channel protein [Chryseobacterium taklimakanense]|uniref:chloride channel protein n=1 Tax=Chryseobacterium taklimakanense TaxID=536441 RepID=UPI000F5F60C7|nr:chloride channel protein [Chryseobacterium taklimakanense]AZI22635.1 chloride channel protein [Chryseobacterium taklimakanense]
MKRTLRYLRYRMKHAFDNIRNEQLKHNMLQAVPFWVASFLTGVAAVMYAKLFQWAEDVLQFILRWNALAIFIVAPLGFILSWWLVKKYAPYAKGSGIPQVMASVDLASPRDRYKLKYLLSYKILVIKIISSIVLVLGGGAVGREGPTIQIAGSIFRFVNQLLPKWWPKISIQNMIMTGAAAGLSAAFNTPLGGIVFAVEELAKVHLNHFKTALFTAVIVAGLTAQWLAGSYLYLGYPKTAGVSVGIIFPVLAVSLACGLLSSNLSIIMLRINRLKKRLKTDTQNIIFLVISAWIIASLAYFVNWETVGSGKGIIERVLFTSNKEEQWYVPLLRMIGPALSFTSGGAGGIFAPALSAWASFGAFFSGIMDLQSNETNVVILAGMVAFLTGITRAPFTSAILVLEMTDRHSLIFYLMVAGMASSLVSLTVSRDSLYDRLKLIYMAEIEEKTKRTKIKLEDLGNKAD